MDRIHPRRMAYRGFPRPGSQPYPEDFDLHLWRPGGVAIPSLDDVVPATLKPARPVVGLVPVLDALGTGRDLREVLPMEVEVENRDGFGVLHRFGGFCQRLRENRQNLPV